MPRDPDFTGSTGSTSSTAKVYGTIYKTGSQTNKEVPCALCQSRGKNVLMIPGRSGCYPGFTVEYTGRLASSHYEYNKATYICVDRAEEPTVTDYTGRSHGAWLYGARAECDALPCSIYPDGADLLCVVCSQNET